jgi:hypothetical protein
MTKITMDMVRAGGMLAMGSAFFMQEFIARFIYANPDADIDNNRQRATLVMTVLGVFYCAYAILTGMLPAVFGVDDKKMTISSMVFSIVFGIVTFFMICIVNPIENFQDNIAPPTSPADNFTREDERTALAFGEIFSLISMYACVHGSQIYNTAKLFHLQQNGSFKCPSYIAAWFAIFIAIGGFSTFVFGGLVASVDGSPPGEITDPYYFYPPNMVKYVQITILTGIVLMIQALSIFIAMCCKAGIKFCYAWSIITFIWLVSAQVMSQYGLTGNTMFVEAAVYCTNGYVMTCLAPVIVLADIHRDDEDVVEVKAGEEIGDEEANEKQITIN